MMNTPIKGRGAADNPTGRFEKLDYTPEPEPSLDPDEEPVKLKTEFYKDTSRSVITMSDSADLGHMTTLNPYRGCEHGCIYCYARPTHEYLGLSSGLDFESKIFVKENAAQLLREELQKKSWKPQVISLSGITDSYQPIERQLKITRQCLEVLLEYKNPVSIITKNHLVTRDIDILSEMAKYNGAAVFLSVTTLDDNVASVMEPRTSRPASRLAAIEAMAKNGIPVGTMIAPVVPGLTDHEIPQILNATAGAGAEYCGYVVLRLPHAVKDLFLQWLENHFPDRKNKVVNRLKSLHDGKLYNAEFGSRMTGEGIFAEQIANLFEVSRRKAGFQDYGPHLSCDHFQRAPEAQMSLF